jgi:hypothetical protein
MQPGKNQGERLGVSRPVYWFVSPALVCQPLTKLIMAMRLWTT